MTHLAHAVGPRPPGENSTENKIRHLSRVETPRMPDARGKLSWYTEPRDQNGTIWWCIGIGGSRAAEFADRCSDLTRSSIRSPGAGDNESALHARPTGLPDHQPGCALGDSWRGRDEQITHDIGELEFTRDEQKNADPAHRGNNLDAGSVFRASRRRVWGQLPA